MAKLQADIHFIGATVSTGTFKTADLLGSFATVLREIAEVDDQASNRNDTFKLIGKAELLAEVLDELTGQLQEDNVLTGMADHVLEELIEALDDAAPEGCTFGTHEGDGALFGFWPTGEEEE